MTHLWNDCSRLLESELTPQQFSAWIKPLKALEFDESTATLTICAPNRLKLDAIRSQFSEQIAGAVSRVMQRPISIVFAIEGGGYADASALRFPLNGGPGRRRIGYGRSPRCCGRRHRLRLTMNRWNARG